MTEPKHDYFYKTEPGKIHRDVQNLNGVVLVGGGRVQVCPSFGEVDGKQIRASMMVTNAGEIPETVDLTPVEAQAIIKRLQNALQIAYRRAQDFRKE